MKSKNVNLNPISKYKKYKDFFFINIKTQSNQKMVKANVKKSKYFKTVKKKIKKNIKNSEGVASARGWRRSNSRTTLILSNIGFLKLYRTGQDRTG